MVVAGEWERDRSGVRERSIERWDEVGGTRGEGRTYWRLLTTTWDKKRKSGEKSIAERRRTNKIH